MEHVAKRRPQPYPAHRCMTMSQVEIKIIRPMRKVSIHTRFRCVTRVRVFATSVVWWIGLSSGRDTAIRSRAMQRTLFIYPICFQSAVEHWADQSLRIIAQWRHRRLCKITWAHKLDKTIHRQRNQKKHQNPRALKPVARYSTQLRIKLQPERAHDTMIWYGDIINHTHLKKFIIIILFYLQPHDMHHNVINNNTRRKTKSTEDMNVGE